MYIWQKKVDEVGKKGVKTRFCEAVKQSMCRMRQVAQRGLSVLLRRRTQCPVQVSLIYMWHTRECIMAHIWMSHGTRMNESWYTYEWVLAHIRMSYVTHRGEACRCCFADAHNVSCSSLCRDPFIYACHESLCAWHDWLIMAHMWMSHVTHADVMSIVWLNTNASFVAYKWVSYKFINES